MSARVTPLHAAAPGGSQPKGLFRRVVVGIGADGGFAALALARALAPLDAALMLVHVRHAPGVIGALPVTDAPEDSTGSSVDLLHEARAALGSPCEIVVEEAASVAAGLHQVAEREQADLIVVAAGERDARSGDLARILHHAPCAVAIAPSAATGVPVHFTRIAVGYRPTAPGRHGALVARTIADEQGAELHAVTVVPVTPNRWLGPAAGGFQILSRLDGTLAEIAQADLEAISDVVDHVLEGDPIHELQHFSTTVDLLVIGTRSAGPLRRMLSGSTADALSGTSQSALLVTGTTDTPSARAPAV